MPVISFSVWLYRPLVRSAWAPSQIRTEALMSEPLKVLALAKFADGIRTEQMGPGDGFCMPVWVIKMCGCWVHLTRLKSACHNRAAVLEPGTLKGMSSE